MYEIQLTVENNVKWWRVLIFFRTFACATKTEKSESMKKIILLLTFFWISIVALWAVPAHKGSVRVPQPDGTMLTLRLVGDEYLHFNTTGDGYSVVKNDQGAYVYACKGSDGQLAPTALVAHDADERQQAELAYLQGVGRYLAPEMTPERAAEQQAEQQRQAKARAKRRAPQYDYSNFRGLLILVEFNDRSFTRSDIRDLMDDMVNKENYTGYIGTNGRRQNYTGSVRDYFHDNSDGRFTPEFDVYGPYKIDYSQYDARGTGNAALLTNAALDAADDDVDFSLYDRDGDSVVDMVYFIFAGYGANFGGNDSRLYWPHRSIIYNPNGRGWDDWAVVKDDVYLYDYASSVELYGYTAYPSTVTIDGIGTICHEFGHVLGLPDFYDADYEASGGESNHPGEWSIMAGGSYENYGRTPVGYSLFERYAVGFAEPQTITEEGSYTLPELNSCNTGYRLNTPVNREFFFFENRQQNSKWDRSLPSHGMLVYRVDSTSTRVWENNSVNNNPRHNYYEIVRAGGTSASRASDPFPGSRNVRTLNNTTSPASLLTWSGQPSRLGLANIREQGGVVTFDVEDVYVLRQVSLPDSELVFTGTSLLLQAVRTPDYVPCTLVWSSSNPDVAVVDAEGKVTGVSDGQTVITVRANDSDELVAECLVTVETRDIIANIADFKAQDDVQSGLLALSGAEVLYVYNGNLYVRDSSGTILLPQAGINAVQGQLLDGLVMGRTELRDNIPYFIPDEAFAPRVTLSEGPALQPRELLLADITDADYADYMTLHQVSLQRTTVGGVSGIFAIGGDRQVRLFNTFGMRNITAPKVIENKYFDVTGILVTRQGTDMLIDELALMSALVEVEGPEPDAIGSVDWNPSTPIDVYTTDGRRVASTTLDAIGRLPLRRGIYILRSADDVMKIVRR